MFLRGDDSTDVLGEASDMDTLVGNTSVAGVWQMRVIDGNLQIDDFATAPVTGNANPNTINGTDYFDQISGGGGNDTINGLLGIDRLNGDEGDDSIRGGEDSDIIHGGADNDRLFGDAGSDTIYGDAGDDTLDGGFAFRNEIDILDGGMGADSLVSGSGRAFASYLSSEAGLTVNLSTPGSNTGDAAGDRYNNIFNVMGSGFADQITGNTTAIACSAARGADNINGLNGSDTLFGGLGDDNINGDGGADVLIGGEGADTLNGGASRDTASYELTKESLLADLADAYAKHRQCRRRRLCQHRKPDRQHGG